MSHIFFSIRTFLFAFVMLASSLLVRPMIGDPPGTEKVLVASDVTVAEAASFDYVSLVGGSDRVFVGRIVEATVLDRSDESVKVNVADTYEVEVMLGLKNAKPNQRFMISLPLDWDGSVLQKLAGSKGQEAFFFLRPVAEGDFSLQDEVRGVLPVDGDKLLGVPEADMMSAKMLARNIAVEVGRR